MGAPPQTLLLVETHVDMTPVPNQHCDFGLFVYSAPKIN